MGKEGGNVERSAKESSNGEDYNSKNRNETPGTANLEKKRGQYEMR